MTTIGVWDKCAWTDIIRVSSFLYFLSTSPSDDKRNVFGVPLNEVMMNWSEKLLKTDRSWPSSEFQGYLTLPGHLSPTFYLTCPSSRRFASECHQRTVPQIRLSRVYGERDLHQFVDLCCGQTYSGQTGRQIICTWLPYRSDREQAGDIRGWRWWREMHVRRDINY